MHELMKFKDVSENTLRPGETIILYSYPMQKVLLYYACTRDSDGQLTLKFHDIRNKVQEYKAENLDGYYYVKLLPGQHLPVIKSGVGYKFDNI